MAIEVDDGQQGVASRVRWHVLLAAAATDDDDSTPSIAILIRGRATRRAAIARWLATFRVRGWSPTPPERQA
jgi:hypothetical protein